MAEAVGVGEPGVDFGDARGGLEGVEMAGV